MQIDPAALQILHYPDPRLRKVCAPVETFDASLSALASRMLALMHASTGIGLAATQVGVFVRMFVCNPTGKPDDDRVYVNPKLSDFTGVSVEDEGCLSIPDVTVAVRRSTACVIDAQDLAGRPVRLSAKDLLARCWQHECDHLDGKLIVDRMSDGDKIANRRALRELDARFKTRSAGRK